MLRKIVFVLGGVILVLLLALGAGYYYFVQRPLPVTDGEIRVDALRAPVKVLRDRWGVPHIYASNEHDLFVAQGFVQAQDRLWQMETNRRLAAGRLSEIFGPETLELDKLARTLGFMRAARKELATYDASSLEMQKAFSDGVNALIAHRGDRLPLEFRILGVQPEPWRPEHSAAWAKVMAMLGGMNWQEEIIRAMLVNKLGENKARDLLRHHETGTPTIIPPGLSMATTTKGIQLARTWLSALGGASNNWVVHGSRTITGFPLLANDMHLEVRVPSVWYEMHLVGGDFDIVGLSLPGVPLIIAGHNPDLAWGITFAYVDVQDIYLERFDPGKKGHYLYEDEWLEAELIKERIKVKGEDEPVLHNILRTRHGPVISTHLTGAGEFQYALSLKWSAHDPGGMLPTMKRLNLASSWEAFKAAAQDWTEPAINLVYADRKGNIGYVLASRVPIRRQGHGQGPFRGWDGGHEWVGYLNPDQKPFLLNPKRGFVATANNQIVRPDYPHYLGVDYASGFRAAQIEAGLAEKNKVSKSDFRTLQGDLKCLPAAKFLSALNAVKIQSTEARDLLERLGSWNQVLSPDSAGGAIYAVLFSRLLENTFRDELGPLADPFFGMGLTLLEPLNNFVQESRVILLNLLSEPDSLWFDNVNTPGQETLAEVLERSLNETATFLRKKMGTDPSTWRWGRLHRVVFEHPLGRVKPLDRVFNFGPYEGGGHFATVWQSAIMPGMDFDLNGWTVSNRHIYDLEDWDQSLGAIVPGQSGMLGSRHYGDQVSLWLEVKHHPLYYTRGKVESEAAHSLVLAPGKG
ncbi:MAG: penicillin acylase family protein [Desulfobacteraceae bacterium]|jgi:penicillin amidase